jgi:hypothetical protein
VAIKRRGGAAADFHRKKFHFAIKMHSGLDVKYEAGGFLILENSGG